MVKGFGMPPTPAGMGHEELRALLPAYAFGATDAEETRQVALHVKRCHECRALLASYDALSKDMLYVAPGVAAPAGANAALQRKLARSAQRPVSANTGGRASVRLAWLFAALALLTLVLTNVYWFGRMGRLEQQVASQIAQLNALSTTPTAVLYGAEEGQHGRGVVYAAGGSGPVLLCVYDMPELPEGQAYQVWLTRGEQRDSGGVFRVSPKGYGLLLMNPQYPLTEYEMMGVTVEPAEGSSGPTSPRVIGGRL